MTNSMDTNRMQGIMDILARSDADGETAGPDDIELEDTAGPDDLDDEVAGAELEAEEGDTALLPPVETDPYDAVRRTQLSSRIQRALEELPPYHRGVILMREVEGMSYEEMAEAMRVSKGTIMSRLFHARKKLQRALSDCYDEECAGAKGA